MTCMIFTWCHHNSMWCSCDFMCRDFLGFYHVVFRMSPCGVPLILSWCTVMFLWVTTIILWWHVVFLWFYYEYWWNHYGSLTVACAKVMQTCSKTFIHEQNEMDMELKRQLRRIKAIKINRALLASERRHAWPSPEAGFPEYIWAWLPTTLTQVKEECSSEDEDEVWVCCLLFIMMVVECHVMIC